MKKLLGWLSDNILFVSTLFLLAFIPLYPKLPLVDVKNTWVYIRAEDFVVVIVMFLWVVLFVRRKVTLKIPLTLPLIAFWIAGAISTLHGVVLIFPDLPNVFPNVAFLSYLRHLEYMSLFFIAFAGMSDKKFLKSVVAVVVLTLLGVVFYGFGQKYLGFYAYLTMNEEFAKGIPIQLSQLSRVPSTFAGHYDLAAYLVLVIPIVASLFFGFKNWFIKIAMLIVSGLGFILLFMTVSRVSFFVLFISLFIVLLFQKKKFVFLTIPIIAIAGIVFIYFSPSLLSRFGSTVKEVDVLVDSKTGESIGHVQFVPSSYVADKFLEQRRVGDKSQIDAGFSGNIEAIPEATSSGTLPLTLLPVEVPLVSAVNVSTGETLPQGTGYINLALSPVTKKLASFFYELDHNKVSTSAAFIVFHGDFIVKRAAAYDLSFTTRFQGEWPRAIDAFTRNILFGSGYGSVSLAVDNNYFRMLGEIGLLGTVAFFVIFLSVGIYVKKIIPSIDSPLARSFVFGFVAGVVGLALNAILIDVFEASKIAFILWLLTGVTMGLLFSYSQKHIDLVKELLKAASSPIAVVLYIFLGTFVIYSPMLSNYFVGDDFTWLRWAADCKSFMSEAACSNTVSQITNYFTNADGFFYRPGTKAFFLFMFSTFWLNQVVYHAMSIILHFIATALFYLLARKILKDNALSAFAAVAFLALSSYSEAIFWISSIGYLFNAVFTLSAMNLYIIWLEKKKSIFLIFAIISMAIGLTFHEVGVVAPLLLLLYRFYKEANFKIKDYLNINSLLLFLPVIVYLAMRIFAGSHWFSGDYSYNILKLPLNFAGNIFGYSSTILAGPLAFSFYEALRSLLRENIIIGAILLLSGLFASYLFFKRFVKKIDKNEARILVFGGLFFIIALLPFLGLGNITSRYSYLASMGIVLILVFFAKKIYDFLLHEGKSIAVAGIILISLSFSMLHVIAVQGIHRDWHGAGNKVKRFLNTIDAQYLNYWSSEVVNFHFVDVPTREGEAWVFPVGMNDALWFTFKNPDLRIYQSNDLQATLKNVQIGRNTKVFQFDGDGGVKEVIPYKKEDPQGSPVSPYQILVPID